MSTASTIGKLEHRTGLFISLIVKVPLALLFLRLVSAFEWSIKNQNQILLTVPAQIAL